MWNCPSSLGETKCDGFFGGFGTYNCLCKDFGKNASVTVACSIQLSIHQYSLFISFEGCQIQKLVLNRKEDSCYDAMKVACVKKE
jgi:hypothetical protein